MSTLEDMDAEIAARVVVVRARLLTDLEELQKVIGQLKKTIEEIK
jgi:hypothetical protein